jgi:hypothetical protein
MAVGALETASKGHEVYAIKMGPDGSYQWRGIYGGYDDEEGYCIRQVAPDSGYVIVGRTDSYGAGDWDLYLLRIDASGDTLWTATYGDTLRDWGWEIELLHHNQYLISGSTASYGAGSDDVYLLRTQGDPAGIDESRPPEWQASYLRTRPSPSAGTVTLEYGPLVGGDVEVLICDCKGRKIRHLRQSPTGAGEQAILWDGKDAQGRYVASGIYFCTLKTGCRTEVVKSVMLR